MPSVYFEEIPEQMRAKLIAFAKGLQDEEDVYFYHPRWKKNINTSRHGRDLNWVTDMLRQIPTLKTIGTITETKTRCGTQSAIIEIVTIYGTTVGTGFLSLGKFVTMIDKVAHTWYNMRE